MDKASYNHTLMDWWRDFKRVPFALLLLEPIALLLLEHLLFANREIPQTHGVSSFKLISVRQMRGPLALVEERWGSKLLI